MNDKMIIIDEKGNYWEATDEAVKTNIRDVLEYNDVKLEPMLTPISTHDALVMSLESARKLSIMLNLDHHIISDIDHLITTAHANKTY